MRTQVREALWSAVRRLTDCRFGLAGLPAALQEMFPASKFAGALFSIEKDKAERQRAAALQRAHTVRTLAIVVTFVVAIPIFAAFPSKSETVLYRERDNGYFIHRIPALLTTLNGTLLAFCEARIGSAKDSAATDIVLRRSVNNGRTWSKPKVVAHARGWTIGNPTPVLDRKNGVVSLLLSRNPEDETQTEIEDDSPEGTRTVWICRSNDDGATWTSPVEITSQVKKPDWTWYATGPGNGIQLSSGRLLIPCDHRVKGSRVSFSHVIYSDDHGATWHLGGTAGPQTNESAVAQLADGSLLLNMRSFADQHLRAIAESTDDGLTWSPTRFDPALTEPICQGTLIRYTLASDAGRNRLLFANPADTSRDRMTVRLSYDEGKTWPVSRLIFEGFSEYSSLAILRDRSIGLLYTRGPGKPNTPRQAYAPQGTEIVFARFNLEWLTRGKDHLRKP